MAEWKIVISSSECNKGYKIYDGSEHSFACYITGEYCTEENCKRAFSKFEKPRRKSMTREKFIAGLCDLMNWDFTSNHDNSFLYLKCHTVAKHCFTYQIENKITKELRKQLLNIEKHGRFIFDGDAN